MAHFIVKNDYLSIFATNVYDLQTESRFAIYL